MELPKGEPVRLLRFGGLATAVVAVVASTVVSAGAGSILTEVYGTNRRSEDWASAASGYLAVSQSPADDFVHSNLLVVPEGEAAIRVNPNHTNASFPSIELGNVYLGDVVVYAQWRDRGQRDLKVFDLAGSTISNPPAGVNTVETESRPSLSGDHLLFGRGPVGGSLRRVVLFDLASGTSRILDRAPYVWPGLVNGDWVTYQTCGSFCIIWRYQISTDNTTQVPTPDRGTSYFPAVDDDGTVYYGVSGRRCGQNVRLMRHVTGANRPSEIRSFPDGVDVFPGDVFEHNVYFGRYDCERGEGDVYRLTP